MARKKKQTEVTPKFNIGDRVYYLHENGETGSEEITNVTVILGDDIAEVKYIVGPRRTEKNEKDLFASFQELIDHMKKGGA